MTSSASACWTPDYAVVPGKADTKPAEAEDVVEVASLRVLTSTVSKSVKILAVEFEVISGSREIKTGSIVSVIAPDSSSACGTLFDPRSVTKSGVLRGFVALSKHDAGGMYQTRFSSVRNARFISDHDESTEWKPAKWAVAE